MWTADKLYYRNESEFTRAYSGDTLIWEQSTMAVEPVSMSASSLQTIRLSNDSNTPNMQYSYDKNSWSDWDYSALSFGTGNNTTIYFRGYNPNGFSKSSTQVSVFRFGTSASVSLSGNIMSLINYTASTLTIPSNWCFYSLFNGSTPISTICDEFMPATGLTNCCYHHMFSGCTALTTAPTLPATTMASGCYLSLFEKTAISSVPDDYLPSIRLAEECYVAMFQGTRLTKSPNLPATALKDRCYYAMFRDCYSLNEIHCDATAISASMCTYLWVQRIPSSGNFYGKSAAGWSTGDSGIPSGWTAHLT